MRLASVSVLPLLLLWAACRGATPATAPTFSAPPIIVVTATPDPKAATRVLGQTNPAPGVPTPNETEARLKPTEVQFIRAKEDVNIRGGPGTNYPIVGGIFAGQTAKVTGYMSPDGQWWRVACPTGGRTDCWVSADPALTEPIPDASSP